MKRFLPIWIGGTIGLPMAAIILNWLFNDPISLTKIVDSLYGFWVGFLLLWLNGEGKK